MLLDEHLRALDGHRLVEEPCVSREVIDGLIEPRYDVHGFSSGGDREECRIHFPTKRSFVASEGTPHADASRKRTPHPRRAGDADGRAAAPVLVPGLYVGEPRTCRRAAADTVARRALRPLSGRRR